MFRVCSLGFRVFSVQGLQLGIQGFACMVPNLLAQPWPQPRLAGVVGAQVCDDLGLFAALLFWRLPRLGKQWR